MFAFVGIVIFLSSTENTNSGFVYYPAKKNIIVQQTITTDSGQQITTTGQQNTGSNTQNPQQNTQETTQSPDTTNQKPAIECSTFQDYEESCRADNGCFGARIKECVNGFWKTSNCTTTFNLCNDGMCKLDCRTNKEKYADKYNLNDHTLILFYMSGYGDSNSMLSFMKNMENVYLLDNGKDVWFQSYLGVSTIPSVVCFNNNIKLEGVKTQSEVEDFKLRNC